MIRFNPDTVNRINISGIDPIDSLVTVYSIVANCSGSRDNFVKRQHNHSFFELHYLLEGTVVYELQDRSITVTRDQYLIIPPRIPHKIVYNSDDFVKLSISFRLAPAYDLLQAQFTRKMVFEASPEIKSCIDFVLKQAEHRNELSQRLIKLRLHELIFHVADHIAQPTAAPNVTEHGDDRLLRAKKYIEDNPHIFFTCAEVADYCHISVKQLGRLFRKLEGQSPLEFIHQQKIETAKQMLNGGLSQKTVSEELGFNSVSYFNKFFIRLTGMSPKQFVMQNRADNEK